MCLVEPQPIISPVPRLVGIDGKAKMSKSLGNAIFLSDAADEVAKKVMSMYTDPDHVRVTDPGKIEGNVVFMYLIFLIQTKKKLPNLRRIISVGGLGDVVLKKRLTTVLNDMLEPIRMRRAEFAKDPDAIMNVLHKGTQEAQKVAAQTMSDVRKVMYLNYF